MPRSVDFVTGRRALALGAMAAALLLGATLPASAQTDDVQVNLRALGLGEQAPKGEAPVVLRYPGSEEAVRLVSPTLRYPDIQPKPKPSAPVTAAKPAPEPEKPAEANKPAPQAKAEPKPAPAEPAKAPAKAAEAKEPAQQAVADAVDQAATPAAPAAAEATKAASAETASKSAPAAEPAPAPAGAAETETADIAPAPERDANAPVDPRETLLASAEAPKPVELNNTVEPALARIAFDSDSAAILGIARGELDEIAASLRDDPRRIQLRAYGGEPGDLSSTARRLSLKRGLAVRAYLIEQGVDSTRIDVRALGGVTDTGAPDRVDIAYSEG